MQKDNDGSKTASTDATNEHVSNTKKPSTPATPNAPVVIEHDEEPDAHPLNEVEPEEEDKKGIAFKPKKFDNTQYTSKKVSARVSQIRDFGHPFRPINPSHEETL